MKNQSTDQNKLRGLKPRPLATEKKQVTGEVPAAYWGSLITDLFLGVNQGWNESGGLHALQENPAQRPTERGLDEEEQTEGQQLSPGMGKAAASGLATPEPPLDCKQLCKWNV